MTTEVTGIDAGASNIRVAALHAERQGLAIDYRQASAESLARSGAQYDIVLALEIVEHVADADLFLRSCSRLVKPNGLLFLSTLNRTAKAWALAIAGAEYVLGWLPRGTHRWDKLVTPNELEIALELAGLGLIDKRGVIYDLFGDCWRLAHDTDVNYMLTAKRPEAS